MTAKTLITSSSMLLLHFMYMAGFPLLACPWPLRGPSPVHAPQVVQHEKARAVLIGQWGFSELSGTVCLFSGPPGWCLQNATLSARSGPPYFFNALVLRIGIFNGLVTCILYAFFPGTGKTLAAEAIGFETGKPLKV